jgi:serine/threonine-protein kinase
MTQDNPLGRYTILRELGRGAIGTVYAARDRSTGAGVAVKTLDPALFAEPNAKLAELFLKNARSAARLRHRNIVKVHDAGEAAGSAYVAMELLEGESLRAMLDKGALPIARAIQIFDDIASALAYAHEEGMVHRGVKPSNIIVLGSGAAKIGDFGIGQIGKAALRYMSPEQVRGGPVDHRSDLFSLGAVFYEMLTRRSPFEGDSAEQVKESILHAQPPAPSKVNPHVPAALDALVLSMLAARPDERFANARVLLRDLQRIEEALGLGPTASLPTASLPPSVPAVQPATVPVRAPKQHVPASEPIYAHDPRFTNDRRPTVEQSNGSRTGVLAALALMLALVSIGVSVVLHYSPDAIDQITLARRIQEPPATPAAAPSPTPAPPAVTEETREREVLPRKPEALPRTAEELPHTAEASPHTAEALPHTASDAKPEESPVIVPAPKPVPPEPLVEQPSPPAQTESLPAPEPEPPATGGTAPAAKLLIEVSPQGELYIDEKHYGTTPPLTTIDLEPGVHRIEIRSGSRKPYLTYMTVKPGEERRIRHDFGAKPSRPPG